MKGLYTAGLATAPFWFVGVVGESGPFHLAILVVFAFIVFRELLLDAIDLDGDTAFGIKSAASILGRAKSTVVGWVGMTVSLSAGVFFVEPTMYKLALGLSVFATLAALAVFGTTERGLKATRVSMAVGVLASIAA